MKFEEDEKGKYVLEAGKKMLPALPLLWYLDGVVYSLRDTILVRIPALRAPLASLPLTLLGHPGQQRQA